MQITPPPMPEPARVEAAQFCDDGIYFADHQLTARDTQWLAIAKDMAERLEAAEREVEELRFLDADLLYWVDRTVGNGNANSDIEDAYGRYEEWRNKRAAMKKEPQQ